MDANVVKNEQNERNATNIFDRDAKFRTWEFKKIFFFGKEVRTPNDNFV